MIVVIGATGTIGREVVALLANTGAAVGAITRTPAAARLPAGVRVIEGDPGAPSIPETAWNGAEAVLLSSRALVTTAPELLAAAARHGARRVVVVSASSVEYPVGEPRFRAGFERVERAATESGLAWTLLRCTDFAANALSWAPQIRAGDVVRGAYGAAAASPIHQRDVAEVAVRALTEDGHAGRSYLLSGPRSLTQRARVRLIGDVIGRELSFLELPPGRVRAAMSAQGLPEEIVARALGSLAGYAETPGPTTDTVARLLGRPALDFTTWAEDYASAFES
ncbi:NAD(P)H-binding protein [Nocardia spumae]|uniref:NAD(P)H-binding protein n=1 Tax=Nocardia spumae TaxID=2887190 RepID=UPI001D153685|nr:NAD(P)H-binding protein [Nocardia spumae]